MWSATPDNGGRRAHTTYRNDKLRSANRPQTGGALTLLRAALKRGNHRSRDGARGGRRLAAGSRRRRPRRVARRRRRPFCPGVARLPPPQDVNASLLDLAVCWNGRSRTFLALGSGGCGIPEGNINQHVTTVVTRAKGFRVSLGRTSAGLSFTSSFPISCRSSVPPPSASASMNIRFTSSASSRAAPSCLLYHASNSAYSMLPPPSSSSSCMTSSRRSTPTSSSPIITSTCFISSRSRSPEPSASTFCHILRSAAAFIWLPTRPAVKQSNAPSVSPSASLAALYSAMCGANSDISDFSD